MLFKSFVTEHKTSGGLIRVNSIDQEFPLVVINCPEQKFKGEVTIIGREALEFLRDALTLLLENEKES